MKKTILLFFVITGIISCTENDSNLDTTVSDLIIGEWQLQSIIENGVDVDLTECELKSTLTFNQDNSLTGVSYIMDGIKSCYSEDEKSIWKNKSDDTFIIDGCSIDVFFSENNTALEMKIINKPSDHEGLFKGMDNVHFKKK
jgi:hypothetical protein